MIKRFEFNDESRSFIPSTGDKKRGKDGAISEGFFLQKRVTLMVDGKEQNPLNRGSLIDFLNKNGADLKKGTWGLRSLPFILAGGATNVEIQAAFNKAFPKQLSPAKAPILDEVVPAQLTTDDDIFGEVAQIIDRRLQEMQPAAKTDKLGPQAEEGVDRRLPLYNQAINDAVLAKLFTERLEDLKRFTEINLSDNQLTKIPSAIGELTQLLFLELSGNPLTHLPGEISKLNRLETLVILNNDKFVSIPALPVPASVRTFAADEYILERYPALRRLTE
jgi:hypothetical protein